MKSNPPDYGRPEGLHYDDSQGADAAGRGADDMPRELMAAIDRVRPRLGRLASTLLFFETVGSTNDVAAARSATAQPPGSSPQPLRSASPRSANPRSASPRSASPRSASLLGERREGLVVVAAEQTLGRGRRDHTWFSPAGSGLYVSVVLAPATARIDPARATTLLTLAAGVALAEGVEQAAGLHVDLKWPNDLQVSRRKLGGILAESSGTGGPTDTVVVGYGINVLATAFPPELGDRATSLESELGRAIDRHHLLGETLAALSRRYEDLLAGRFDAILDAWRRLAPAASGARVAWTTNAGAATGVTAGIDDLGALLVRVDDRVERIVSGEVIWL